METLEAFTDTGFRTIAEATKRSNSLPNGQSRDLYECYPSFHSTIEKQADYVLEMLSKMLKSKKIRGLIGNKDDDDKFEMIVDSNDVLLENVGTALDELSGIRRNPEAQFVGKEVELINGSWNKNRKGRAMNEAASQLLNKILHQTKSIEKPQLKFKDKPDNDWKKPFEPKIKFKYNMLKPLSCILECDEDGISHFSHPYEFELEKFKVLSEQLKHKDPVHYKSLEDTPLILLSTPEQINEMVNELEKEKEIAVDLEHHSYRSFQGFTCLMQISSREKDYIIDTLCLRSELQPLNKIFTNPSIVKVFHGADLDVLWLQRDLGLYVVNMFDTHQAAKLLNFPKLSLAYLLAHYCQVEAQKQFQLADWRIRPLPQELITYAREDTHYLLFIYDNLRNSLLEKANGQTNLLEAVYSESTRICLKRYIKPGFKKEDFLDLYRRSKKLFDNRQKFALEQLFSWRDKAARASDESYSYILPDHMMLNISEVLPREAQGILACCNPVPVPVRQHLMSLHQMILRAREQPLVKPVLEEQRFHKSNSRQSSSDDPLQCPHDLNHDAEFRDDLPVLIPSRTPSEELDKEKGDVAKPIISVFENCGGSRRGKSIVSGFKRVVHITPYHRYKQSKTFAEFDDTKSTGVAAERTSHKIERESGLGKNAAEENNNGGKERRECEKTKREERKRKAEDTEKWERKKKEERKSKSEVERVKIEENEEKVLEEEKEGSRPHLKKENKKGFVKRKQEEFEPFDYKSVDFKKFKNPFNTTTPKKGEKKCRQRKKAGKNKFKISI